MDIDREFYACLLFVGRNGDYVCYEVFWLLLVYNDT